MRLSTLEIRNFRNLGVQDLELPEEGVALIGDNAQGKSNFLEAIYYLETFRSFRGARDEQLVAFGEPVFRVVGTTAREPSVRRAGEVAAAFEKRGRRKKVSVDGVEPGRLGDALGRLAAVIFSPSDIDLVSGGPSQRRRFLDIVLSLNEPGYLTQLQDYRRVLVRRNASLKANQPHAAVTAWDKGLVQNGANVVRARRDWLAARVEAFGDYYAHVAGGPRARMEYRPGFSLEGAITVDEIGHAFRAALVESRETECRLGSTRVGPHRDDVRLRLEDEHAGLDLRDYGSGGQRRTAALALRLVEARTVRERRGRTPLILLDDVFAELDEGRSERVLELLETDDTGQVVLTAPKPKDVRLKSDALVHWSIKGGKIST